MVPTVSRGTSGSACARSAASFSACWPFSTFSMFSATCATRLSPAGNSPFALASVARAPARSFLNVWDQAIPRSASPAYVGSSWIVFLYISIASSNRFALNRLRARPTVTCSFLGSISSAFL